VLKILNAIAKLQPIDFIWAVSNMKIYSSFIELHIPKRLKKK